MHSAPIVVGVAPGQPAEVAPEFDPDLHSAISEILRGSTVDWTTRRLAGCPAQELTRIAEEVDAQMIVVPLASSHEPAPSNPEGSKGGDR
ncbi:hypothetical protein [Brevibacterium sp. FME37]|uniref:hypothetical protein n=1 Tax=Brevibacterium sp. FME37 TaxID=2742607 RepID=UPI00186888DA|nr:hypothetical protein [Brevibacterium sp. FME37]